MMVGGVVRSFAFALAVCAATAASAAETSKQSAGKPSASRQAALPSFEFRGHRIGEPIEQNFPYWAQGYRGMNLPYCGERKIPGVYSCDDPTVELNDRLGKRKMVGDVPILALKYNFLDGRLTGVDMFFYFSVYEKIFGMLRGKYGNPQTQAVEMFQDDTGARFQNVISRWTFKEGVLRLRMRFGDAEGSLLTFYNPVAEAERERREQALNSIKGKQAF